MEKRKRIIEELANSKGYHTAILTSFNFELFYFEKAVLNTLYNNGITRVSLFVDDEEFDDAISKEVSSSLGKKYVVSRVAIPGAFHPKLILLLGDKKARLFVMSANIKTSGFEKNNEVFNIIDYSPNEPTDKQIISSAIDFIKNTNSISEKKDEKLVKGLDNLYYYNHTPELGDRYFVDNFEKPIIAILSEVIKEDVTEMRIAVPYYDNYLNGLQALEEQYPNAKIYVFVQQETSTFPKKKDHDAEIKIFDEFIDRDDFVNRMFYHGKVMLFKTNSADYILYGSANCTASALCKTYKENGNIECCLLDKGNINEFDSFFDVFSIINDTELKSNLMHFVNNDTKEFKFINAELKGSKIECTIESHNILDDVIITLDEKAVDYTKENNEYHITIDDNERNISTVFELKVNIGEKQEKIKCWYIDNTVLETNRSRLDRDIIKDCSPRELYETEEFNNYAQNLMGAIITSIDDLKEFEEKENYYKTSLEQIDEEDVGCEEEDYIARGELEYEANSFFKDYSSMLNIRNRFASVLYFEKKENSFGNVVKRSESYEKTDEDIVVKHRESTPEEKRFEYYVKNRIKGVKEDFVSKITLEHFEGILSVVKIVFHKYTFEKRVYDIFKEDYVVKTRIRLLDLLMNKLLSDEPNEETRERFIVTALNDVLENNILIEKNLEIDDQSELKQINKNFLIRIDKAFDIRDSVDLFLEDLYECKNTVSEYYSLSDASKIIDSMFGYKSDKQLICLIKETVDKSANVHFEDDVVIIDASTNEIKRFLIPNKLLLIEIKNYLGKNNNRHNRVKMIIKNRKHNHNIVKIEQSINLEYMQYTRNILYNNGEKEFGKNKNI